VRAPSTASTASSRSVRATGIVAYFGYPVAHEDASERAVRAGLQIVKTIE
jgi:hypothetical protein